MKQTKFFKTSELFRSRGRFFESWRTKSRYRR